MTGRPQLPPAPLLALLAARAREADLSLTGLVRDRLGEGTVRSFERWKAGGTVRRDVADRICVALGAHAVDLWPELARAQTPPNHLEVVVDADWKDRGACRDADPDLFFPDNPDDTTGAAPYCFTCPVWDACFDAGLNERHGIWAGTGETERSEIRRGRGLVLPDPIDPAEHPATDDHLEDIA